MPRPCLHSKLGCFCVLVLSLSTALLPVSAAAQESKQPPPHVAPQPDASTHKAHVVPKQHAPSAEDEAVLRHLELLMLLDMMRDYELFHDDPHDPQAREKTRVKP